jgi:hypothetical protein
MPTKEEYDAMTDNELRKYASTLPLTYNKNWSRAEKDLYNAIQRRDYRLRKQGKTFEYVPKLEIQAKGSSTASELPTERKMSEEKAKQILADAFKFKLAKDKVENEKEYSEYNYDKRIWKNTPETRRRALAFIKAHDAYMMKKYPNYKPYKPDY